jgi:hypothetical protein
MIIVAGHYLLFFSGFQQVKFNLCLLPIQYSDALSTGCDPGAFLLARPGLYIRELGILVLFIIFKGTDLHSGYGSTVDPTVEKLWRDKVMADVEVLWNEAGEENRAGFVSYPSHAAFHRSGTMAITPSLTFGNSGNPRSGEDAYMNFSSNGKHIVGGAHAHYNRLAREIVYLHHNYGQHTGLQGLEDPRDMLKRITYVDDGGNLVHCDPLPFHAVEDAQLLTYWRGRYKWHYMSCEQHRIGVLKHQYKKNQSKILQKLGVNPLELEKLKTRTRIPQTSIEGLMSPQPTSQNIPDSPLTEYDYSSWPSDSSCPLDALPAQSSDHAEEDADENADMEQSSGHAGEDVNMEQSEPLHTDGVDTSSQLLNHDPTPNMISASRTVANPLVPPSAADPAHTSSGPEMNNFGIPQTDEFPDLNMQTPLNAEDSTLALDHIANSVVLSKTTSSTASSLTNCE